MVIAPVFLRDPLLGSLHLIFATLISSCLCSPLALADPLSPSPQVQQREQYLISRKYLVFSDVTAYMFLCSSLVDLLTFHCLSYESSGPLVWGEPLSDEELAVGAHGGDVHHLTRGLHRSEKVQMATFENQFECLF